MTESGTREQALALATNLASMWNGGQHILDGIVEAGGMPGASPTCALASLTGSDLEQLFGSDERRADLTEAFQRLTRYLAAATWFDRAAETDGRLSRLRNAPVAYFCAEFGLASWLPIYSGGLGVLAGDMLKEASDLGLPFVGVGLFYKHGFFHQLLDGNRYQTEFYDTLNPIDLGLSRAVDSQGAEILIEVPLAGRTVRAAVWKVQIGRVPLYLLDTDVPENDRQEDRDITASLYGGDAETRIRQELVLGIGGVRALRALGTEPSVYSMNEGHAAFLGLELLAGRLSHSDFASALAFTRSHIVYTNHTVVPAGNDVFSRELVRAYLGPYAEETRIGSDRLLALASSNEDAGFSMAILAFTLSGKANAVSDLHARVIPREWPGYAVEAVTNGVHMPTWVGPEVQALFDRYVPDWRGDSPSWDRVHTIPDAQLQAAHDRQRRSMIESVNRSQSTRLDPDALTLVWARRFAEYKRAWLLASDRARLVRLLTDAARPVQILISGKAHPRDQDGKMVLQELLHRVQDEVDVSRHVVFVQDYNLDLGRMLVAGADVWLNTPRKPFEASGTSGMKASDNGAVQLTVEDGWAAEVNWWNVGWGIPGVDDATDAALLYQYLEDGIIPTYYDRDGSGVSPRWAAIMKNTMAITLSRYSARRMVLDYLHKLYLPLLEEQAGRAHPVAP